MSKVTRFNSLEAGPFGTSNNIVHLRVPAGAVYDMSDSYIEVEMRVTTTDTVALSDTPVYNVETKYNGYDVPIYNNVLVKSSRVASSYKGQLEEINRCDLLQSSLKHYEQSRSDKDSLEYYSLYQLYNPYRQKLTPFREFLVNSEVKSREVQPRFRIPLKELSGIGEIINLDTSYTGDLTYRLELNVDKLSANVIGDTYELCENLAAADTDTLKLTTKYPNKNAPVYVGQVISVHALNTFNQLESIKTIAYANDGTCTITLNNAITNPNGATNAFFYGGVKCPDVAAGQAASNEIVLNGTFPDLESVPFWNGCLVRCTATSSTAANNAVKFAVVTSVTRDETSGEVTVTCSDDILNATAVGETLSNVFLTVDIRGEYTAQDPEAHAPAQASIKFDQVDMVMYSANPELKPADGYMYSTYVLEQYSGADVQTFNKAFSLEPMCDGVLVTFSPDVNESPYSVNNVIDSYRLRLNNVNLSQRNVLRNKPLYYDDLLKFMTNDARKLNNLESIPAANVPDMITAQNSGEQNIVVPVTCPLTSQDKILNVNVNCSAAGVNTVNVYKSIQKQL